MSRSDASASGRKRARETPPPPPSPAPTEADDPPVRTPFAHFASFKRGEVAAQHQQWSTQRVSSELTRQWKAMDDAERRPFVELAEFDKVRLLQEQGALHTPTNQPHDTMTANDAAPTVAASRREPLPSKRGKPGNEPRQPDTPYICFWKYERPAVVSEFPNMAAPNVSREVGLRWKALSEDQRQEWIDLAARDRKRYDDEMAAYRKRLSNHKKSSELDSTPPTTDDAPAPSAPKSAFQCFLIHNRESLTLLSMTLDEFRREMSDLWKRMSDGDKQVWLDMAAHDQARYETEMAALQRPFDANRSKKRLEELKQAAARMENAPILPQTALAFFTAAKRRKLLLDRPSMKASDVNREVSKAWKAMNAYDRLPFIGDEQRDVERFVREMDARLALDGGVDDDLLLATAGFDLMADQETPLPTTVLSPPSKPTEPLAPSRLGRKAKPVLPKRPMTAYNMMYLAKREELMRTYQLSQNECSALCGRMWRQMAETERQQYYRMAAQDKERYLREMEQHRRSKSGGASGSGKKPATKTTTTRSIKQAESAGPSPWETATTSQATHSFLDLRDTNEDLRRLEQSARAVFDDALVRQHQDAPYDFDVAHTTPGFRYYVDSKRNERERWTLEMWVDDWKSLSPPHRVVWEELASGGDLGQQHHQEQHLSSRFRQQQHAYHRELQPQRQPDHHRTLAGDLDLLYGLARGASSSFFAET